MQQPTCTNGELVRPGDWVKTLVQIAGGIYHHGIVRRVYRSGGQYVIEIVHNTKDGGVMVTSVEHFGDGSLILLERRPSSVEHARMILATADQNVGLSYSVASRNCEHFCSFCYDWEAKSDTLRSLGWMTAAGVVGYLALTDKA